MNEYINTYIIDNINEYIIGYMNEYINTYIIDDINLFFYDILLLIISLR